MDEYITLNHGSGGKLTHDLIENLFAGTFGMSHPMTDSAILSISGSELAFTTDSYVIDPLFFPGGDIGKLAVCGTINDLAVSGAHPLFIAVSFIIEEGFPVMQLKSIVNSMAYEAKDAGVRIVTGDTKVVDRGHCDKIFITTTGVGLLDPENVYISSGRNVKQGDKLIVNGTLADHAVAVLSARKQLNFSTPVNSDCASLNGLISQILSLNISVSFMRDITRGGLAGVVNELSIMTGLSMELNEANIPLNEAVRGVCEILGLDPLHMANEGKLLLVVNSNDAERALQILKKHPLGINSNIIGEVTGNYSHKVLLHTVTGGTRILDMLSGIQLPRIC